jgi:hypothetical protein
VNNVESQDKKARSATSKLKLSADFMPPNTPLVLDPTDKVASKTKLEPTDEVERIDLGEGKTLNIGKAIQGKARDELINFLREHHSVFAWTAVDMPGISRGPSRT